MAARATVSHSSLTSFRQCPHMFDLGYRQRWNPPKISAPLAKGSLFHAVLAPYYDAQRKEKFTRKTAFRAGLRVLQAEVEAFGGMNETIDLVEWMFTGYAERWFDEDADRWKIVAVEQRIKVKLSKTHDLVGVIDLVVRDRLTNELWVVDHKTGKDFPNARKLELDDQLAIYEGQLVELGKPIVGAVWNHARTYPWKRREDVTDEQRFERFPLHFTREQVATIRDEARATHARIEGSTTWERNTGDHCVFRCDFTEACLAGRRGMDEAEFLEASGFTKGSR